MISTYSKQRKTGYLRHKDTFGPNNAVNSLTGRVAECAYGEGLWSFFGVAVVAL